MNITFDGTLGALLIGMNISTIFYGITCVQIFLYATCPRTSKDGWFLKTLVSVLLALDTVHQVTIFIGMYRFLVTDYLNPLQLIKDASTGPASLSFHTGLVCSDVLILLVQLYYTWRLWVFSISVSDGVRWLLTTSTLIFALISFATAMVIVVETGDPHSNFSSPLGNSGTAWKVCLPMGIACDAIITFGMLLNLHQSRSKIQSTNDGMNFLMMSIFNTGLLTIIVSIATLICFYALPSSNLAYGALGLIAPRCYLNSFLATLNSREYLREKMAVPINISFGGANWSSHTTGSVSPSRLESGLETGNEASMVPKVTSPVKVFFTSEKTVNRAESA
ncbi:hypothetical protein BDN72DRAFT_839712 [Pluteus cervinus]|uniref:Uncharacterized protein n=1 Tax=Pluteus cervinus TaxID=181527 RepID=A0ACD3AX51_9AGAR|nr:hypothetical protein BDN72DRAFT_839712 [Pluteus cervinus]